MPCKQSSALAQSGQGEESTAEQELIRFDAARPSLSLIYAESVAQPRAPCFSGGWDCRTARSSCLPDGSQASALLSAQVLLPPDFFALNAHEPCLSAILMLRRRGSCQKLHPRFLAEVCSFLQKEIRKAGGDEVFVAGNINADGIVSQASVASKSLLASLKNGSAAIHAAKHNAKALACSHPSGILRPSGTELAIISRAKSPGLGFYIANNAATEVCVAAEPMPAAKKKPIEPERKIETKADPGQMDLAAKIAAVLDEGKAAVFETDAGVAKSFDCLIPAALWGIENGQRVAVAAAASGLQQQLQQLYGRIYSEGCRQGL